MTPTPTSTPQASVTSTTATNSPLPVTLHPSTANDTESANNSSGSTAINQTWPGVHFTGG